MPRKKKDPDARRAQFIGAAAALFSQKGYNGTSVRDILDAMGPLASSPSAFYYYFKSKDDIYQAVLAAGTERYMAEIEACAASGGDPLEALAKILHVFIRTLASSMGAGEAAEASSDNRMFYSYLLSEIVRRGTAAWERIIARLPWAGFSEEERHRAAAFINGGVGELVRDFSLGSGGDPLALSEQIVDFSASVLKAPASERERFRLMLAELRAVKI